MTLTIAFVSCMNAQTCPEQPVWEKIRELKPDVLLMLGDHIYMDWGLASLATEPGAKRAWEDAKVGDKQTVLDAFRDEMHDRYAMQWQVAPFRELMKAQRLRKLALTWDDHDFAWNNALGRAAGKDKWDEKAAPDAFKDVALRERGHFEWVLRHWSDDGYPGLDVSAAAPLNPDQPVFDERLPGAEVLMLDQRWNRTHRDADGARLLSDPSRARLLEAVKKTDAGLLILAGSSPLKHHSLSGGHSSWWAEPDHTKTNSYDDRAYPEYTDIILKATRPVLYLAGEIHRNAWGGWVEPLATDGTRLPVVQALSSGAALGKLLFHRFKPSYGVVKVSVTGATSQVEVVLHTAGETSEDSRKLRIENGQWVNDSVPEGECTDGKLVTDASRRMLTLVDSAPLPVLAMRRVGKALRDQTQIVLAPEDLDTRGLTDNLPDSGYDKLNSLVYWPLAMRVRGVDDQISLERATGTDDASRVSNVIQETFELARAKDRSVLLFVHGFGKGSAAAISQALELRERFNCEVVLYTWPTGAGSGLFASLAGFAAAKKAAERCSTALSSALAAFCEAASANADVPAVVLARSLGAQALAEIEPNVLHKINTQALKRLVLSAPACKTGSALKKWLNAICCERVITVNREDRTLRLADILTAGQLLGHEAVDPQDPAWVYLDCTDVSGVGSARAHDYIFRNVEVNLFALNELLLKGQSIDFTAQAVPGLVAYLNNRHYP
jgi:Alpha/beta hydrolase of unknown function (DUF900)/PhoD-like phosphatase